MRGLASATLLLWAPSMKSQFQGSSMDNQSAGTIGLSHPHPLAVGRGRCATAPPQARCCFPSSLALQHHVFFCMNMKRPIPSDVWRPQSPCLQKKRRNADPLKFQPTNFGNAKFIKATIKVCNSLPLTRAFYI